MVNESLPSPGYRKISVPSSPYKRSSSGPDISWRSLAHRHKFLLYTLALLTLLCTVYLYFAISWGASDSCSGLGGTQRTQCLQENVKADSLKSHHRRLLYVQDSASPKKKAPFGGRLKEFEAFFSSPASDSIEGPKEIQNELPHDVILGLQNTIRGLRRVNTRLRKTVAILRNDHHTPAEENHTPVTSAIPVSPKAIRLRGDLR